MAQITHAQAAKLFRRLATGYSAGIDIKSLYSKETELGSSSYRQNSQKVYRQICDGATIATAMQAANGYFPDLVMSVVHAGEQGGRLEDAFDRLSTHYENLTKFRNGFLVSIAWPVFELAMAIIIIGALILILGALVGDDAANWFGMGSATANFLFYIACIATVGTAAALAVIGTKNGWFGTTPMKIARRIPLIGKTIEALALSRMAWTMSISENAGMDAIKIARMSLNSTQNYYYKQLQDQVHLSLQNGNTFYKTFRSTEAFPTDFLIYMENGEAAGELAESMDRASRDLQQRAETNLKLIGTIGFACTFVFVGVVIGSVIITMYYRTVIAPLNDLLQ